MHEKAAYYLSRINYWDTQVCLSFNQTARRAWVRALFAAVSRLGDGVFWYSLMAMLVLRDGREALLPVGHMLAVGLTCLGVYKWLKGKTLRPRPYALNQAIFAGAAPLDQFSFPSGHTLHAVGFTLVLLTYYPALGWLVVPFTVLVAVSRLVLGLHYPSDVLAGALIGATVAAGSFVW